MSEQSIPILNEHQSAKDISGSTDPIGYTPTPEEKKAIKLANELFEKAKRHRSKYDKDWLWFYKMFRGKQWKEQRPSHRHSEVINFIFQSIQSQVPIITDSRPKFEYLPQEPSDMEFAQILNEVAQSDWEKKNWLMKLTDMLYDSHIFGTGIPYVGFNPKSRHGAGDIVLDDIDPLHFYPDPNAKDVNDEERSCKYVCLAKPEDVSALKKEYPDKKDFIKSDLSDFRSDRTDLDEVKFKSPVDSKTIVEGGNPHDAGHKDQALKITVYLYDDEFEEEEKTKEDGTKVYEQRLKYPNGRKICIAGGVLLEDGPIPFDDGLLPFARLVNYSLPREFWGMSEVEQLESPQRIFNKLVSFALDVLTLTGNPIWVVDNTSGVDTDNLFNTPGLVVEKEPGSEVRREEGVHLQPYVLQLIDRMANWFDGISGVNDVTQGIRPEGITAASAIQSLQEAAQTRLRLKSRNLDSCLQSVGQLYKNRALQFKTAPEIIRLTNQQGATKFFKFHVEHDDYGNKKAIVRNFTQDPATGQMKEDLEAKEYMIKGDFDVRVTTGSSLPFAKREKIDLAKLMFDSGAIDELELLKAADYPNYEAVWERVQQRKQEKMMMEAQMAQQGGQSAPPAA